MIETQRKSRWEVLRPLVFAAGGVFALGLFAIVMLVSIALNKWTTVRRAWDENLGTREEILERYPPREANSAALALEALTPTLGIDVATRSYDGRDRPTKDRVRRYGKAKGLLSSWLTRELERERLEVEAPPEAAALYLRESRESLVAIRDLLSDGETPRWEQDLARLFAAPIPNLLGHIELHKLMVADALLACHEGDNDRALADLEASWMLNASLRDDPVLITQMIAMSGARMQAGALRKIEQVPERWLDRLRDRSFRKTLSTALKFEGWIWVQLDDSELVAAESNEYVRPLLKLSRPYVRYCMADVSDRWRRRVVRLADLDFLCDRDLEELNASLALSVPRWNRLGQILVPNLNGAIDRLARLELDLELTEKLVLLRSRRADNGGSWPDSLPGIEDSAACPQDRWIYESDPNGSMSLAFSREIEWPDQSGAILPTRFTSEAAVR